MWMPSPGAEPFTEIVLDDIDVDSTTFYNTIENLTSLNQYVNNASLQPQQKRRLYLLTAAWIQSHSEEESKEKIRAILPLAQTKIKQTDDEAIARVFPLLEKIWIEYNIIWQLLDDTELILEEAAEELIRRGLNYHEIKGALQQARQTFIDACKKMVNAVVEKPIQPNKRNSIEAYVATMGKHFAVWHKSSAPPHISAHSQFFIDLTGLNLREIDLRNIPLRHANLKDSRLADCLLAETEVSALQLSTAKEFSLVVDLPAQLLLDAQNEQYGIWQYRLEQRAKKFNTLKAKIVSSDPNKSPHVAQDLSAFEFIAQHYNTLIEHAALLDAHCAQNTQTFDKALFVDLTAEKKSAILLQLATLEKEETLLKHGLVSDIYKARCALCVAYFTEIEQSLNENNLHKALQQFDELLALRLPNKSNGPLPSDLDAKILAIRNNLLDKALSLVESILIGSAEKKETQEKLARTLQQIDSMVNYTLEWELPLSLEVVINKAQRDWIRYRIELEMEQGNLQRAETLTEILLSEAEIAKQAARCFNELKHYKIHETNKFLEGRERQHGKIYISKKKDKNYLTFSMDGSVYRGVLSNEQSSIATELSRLLENPRSKKSILLQAAKDSYVYLKFDLRLQIVEKHIKRSELEQACGKLDYARSELEQARSKMKDILAITKKQKYTLDLRGRLAFKNKEVAEEFWGGLSILGIRLYLDPRQVWALKEQPLQYNEALFGAIKNGNLEEVQYGITHFTWKANLRNQEGCTPVIFACLHGYYDIAHYLCAQGGEVLKITRPGKADINPLDELIQKKYRMHKKRYEPIIRWLIGEGLVLEPKNALILNDAELFKTSLAQLPDDDTKEDKMRELLLTAVKEGSDTVVGLMFDNQKDCVTSFPIVPPKTGLFSFLSPTVTVPKDPPLLHIACKAGQETIVNMLLTNKYTAGSASNKQSALLYLTQSFLEEPRHTGKNLLERQALYFKWKRIATILCTHGAEHNLYTWLILNDDLELKYVNPYINKGNMDKPCDTKGNTPLHFAVKTANIKLVQLLIDNNAQLEPLNLNQETPLHLACEQGHLDIVKCLLKAKAGPDGPRRELTEDERKQFENLAKTFPEMNAFLNKKPLCSKIATPLQYAISNKHPDVVEALCLHKADLEVKLNGSTALHLALLLGRHERDAERDRISVKMVSILLKYGAQISAPNEHGVFPWEIAASTRNIEAMLLLLDAYVNPESLSKEDAIQKKAVFAHLYKIEAKENFCDSLETWALGFRAALHSSESELTAPSAAELTARSSASSLVPLSPSLSLPSSLPPAWSLSAPGSMYPPAKSAPSNPLGAQFDIPLKEYFQKGKDHLTDLDATHPSLSDDEAEWSYATPPEQMEPFSAILSSSEEMKEEEEDYRSQFKFG